MKKRTQAVLVSVLLPWMSSCTVVVGNGKVTTSSRDLTAPFTRVELSGVVDVAVSAAATPSVEVSIDSNLQDLVTTEVRNGTLFVGEKPHTNISTRFGKVTVGMPLLDGATVSGTGNLTASALDGGASFKADVTGTGDLSTSGLTGLETVTATVSGSGNLSLSGLTDLKTLNADVSGTGNLTASGNGTSLSVDVSGTGNADLKDFASQDVVVSVSGTGDATVNASGTCRASVSGTGDVILWGGATITSRDLTGTGHIITKP